MIAPMEGLETAYYLEVEVDDRPGVLSQVAAIFGEHAVSIRSMEQEGLGAEARLIFITHSARERDLQATLTSLAGLEAVRSVGSMLRVVGD
jgi:homoserine dehydrogenase